MDLDEWMFEPLEMVMELARRMGLAERMREEWIGCVAERISADLEGRAVEDSPA